MLLLLLVTIASVLSPLGIVVELLELILPLGFMMIHLHEVLIHILGSERLTHRVRLMSVVLLILLLWFLHVLHLWLSKVYKWRLLRLFLKYWLDKPLLP